MDGETFGFIDLTGKFVIPPEFQQCGDFSDGLAAVCRDERWGFVDHSGEIRVPFVFEKSRARTRIFRNGVAGVKIDGRCGFIDHSGGFVVSPEFEDLKSFSEGYAPVRQNGKCSGLPTTREFRYVILDHLHSTSYFWEVLSATLVPNPA